MKKSPPPSDNHRPGGGRYRKLYVRVWSNPAVRRLDDGAARVFFYLLTGQQTNRVGLYRLSPGEAAEDLQTSVETFRNRLDTVCQTLNWHFDEASRILWIPSWWTFNPPANINMLKGCLDDLNELPQTILLQRFANHVETLPIPLVEPFRGCMANRLGNRLANQEQEQEQDQEQKQDIRARARDSSEKPVLQGRTGSGAMSGALPREHLTHALCDESYSRCVPRAVHDKLANLLAPRHAGNRSDAGEELKSWYPTIWRDLPTDFVMPDAFKFWQAHFDVAFTTRDALSAAAVGRSTVHHWSALDDCPHPERCGSAYLCNLKTELEAGRLERSRERALAAEAGQTRGAEAVS